MDVQEKVQGDWTIVIPNGRIDSQGAVDLDLALQTAVSEGKKLIILDMQDVPYINSSGLRTLADILTQVQSSDGDLRLAALHPKVQRVLEIIGFDNFFSIYDSVDDAL